MNGSVVQFTHEQTGLRIHSPSRRRSTRRKRRCPRRRQRGPCPPRVSARAQAAERFDQPPDRLEVGLALAHFHRALARGPGRPPAERLHPVVGAFVVAVSFLAPTGFCWPALASAESPSVAEVWAREDDYWRFVKAGDVERYVALWHEKFIGWPCDEAHPMRKPSIGAWVQKIRDEKIQVTSLMTREGAEEFGAAVVVHYRFTRVDKYPGGRVEGQGRPGGRPGPRARNLSRRPGLPLATRRARAGSTSRRNRP